MTLSRKRLRRRRRRSLTRSSPSGRPSASRSATSTQDFDRIGEADWVIEVVVERLDVKRDVMARIEEAAREDAVISTNTSGIPIHEIAEGRSDAFKRRFLGTHFFNPPRYLKLLELIPTDATDPDIVQRVAEFGRLHLGKGIVIANDVPYFVGNRVGTYGIFQTDALLHRRRLFD